MVIRIDILRVSLLAATCSAASAVLIYLCLDRLMPFVFILSPFFWLLSVPVGLPILYCWRHFGSKPALWVAALVTAFLYIVLPDSFVLLVVLQLIGPVTFIAAIADLRSHSPLLNERRFIPLSAILASTALFVSISALILAVFLNNMAHITVLIDQSISEMTRILTLTRTLSPQQIFQFEMMLRADNHVLIVRILSLYSFCIALFNFYIASRLERFPKSGNRFSDKKRDETQERESFVERSETKTALGKNLDAARRPRDNWPYDASSLPRIHVLLLVGASALLLLPINTTLQSCLDIISQLLLVLFTLTGLAALHLITRGKRWRLLLLGAVYGILLPLSSSIILALWGIFVSTTSLLQKYKTHPQSTF